MSATFDQFGSEANGETLDGFTFQAKDDNGVDRTYTVPTQILH
ncbi:MAG TPA: hypothetical protein VL053_05245 [Arachidicoccus sp.]|nr:hypothetical protein [Arachidicoccus sp.]